MAIKSEIKNIFPYSRETEEGLGTSNKIYGRMFLTGGSDKESSPGETILVPVSGMNLDGVTGEAMNIPQECEISNMRASILTNTLTEAETTFLFIAFDEDSNALYFEPFAEFLAGETGSKQIQNKTFYLPQGSYIYIFVSIVNGGAGTANAFRWSGVLDILR